MNKELVIKIAELVKEKGGRTFYVGGYVRDLFLGIENKDIDIEVHGVDDKTLKEILNKVGKPLEYGKSFGIYSLANTNIDIALPRTETKIGEGHRDFDIKVDPYISLTDAASRRDFTINSMMIDVLTNELIDPFNGKQDLEKHLIRHVNDKTFIEDPLRIFRAAQFASRFNFEIAEETINLCKTMDETKLSKERIEEELKKALLKSNKPSLFFDNLKKMNKLDYWFKEIKEMIGFKQHPINHPEGDVYNHTMLALDTGTLYRELVSDAYNFMILIVVHDIGKLKTKVMTEDGIHFYGHEDYLIDIKAFLDRIVTSNQTKNYVLEMVPKHMRGHKIYKYKYDEHESNIWFDGIKYPKDLAYLATADKSNHPDEERLPFLLDRYNTFIKVRDAYQITGNDLIKKGIEPSDKFSEYLDYAKDLKYQGLSKQVVLDKLLENIINKKS